MIMRLIRGIFVSKYVGGAVRHAMGALGGAIATLGVVDPEVLAQFVSSGTQVLTGVAMLGVTLLLSYLQKKMD